jgi:hypothetical protein
MMYDNRYQRRQMRQVRRMNRRYYRSTLGGLSGGFFFIGLALAIALSSAIGGNWFLPVFFVGLAFCALIGSATSMNPRGLYGGFQGFVWLMGLAFCFLFGFWPWILVVIGISSILGALYVPLVTGVLGAGIFAAMRNQQQPYQPYQNPDQPYQPYPPYQDPNQPYPVGQEPYQPYQQGYQPDQSDRPGSYSEGGQQHPYPPGQQPQPKQEYDQPQTQYPPQELPPQQ